MKLRAVFAIKLYRKLRQTQDKSSVTKIELLRKLVRGKPLSFVFKAVVNLSA